MGQTIHDHDAILDLWESGTSSRVIGDQFGVLPEYIRTIVQRARDKGDIRAVQRRPGCSPSYPPLVDARVRTILGNEAQKHNQTYSEFCARILTVVANDDLFAALLDDTDEVEVVA